MAQCLIDYHYQWRVKSPNKWKIKSHARTRTGWRCPEYKLNCSGWERRVCEILSARGIPHHHQTRKYPVTLKEGKRISYVPDIEAGDLIIEPHFLIDSRFLKKMAAFKEQYPKKKIVLVTLNDAIPTIPEGIFDEKLPIEYCNPSTPSRDLLIPTMKRMAQKNQPRAWVAQ